MQRRIGPIAAALLITLFAALQIATLDYGTKVNDLAPIAAYKVAGNIAQGSGLERRIVVGRAEQRAETLDLWMVRFKLYSVDADEIMNILALARMRPEQGRFDPGFYQYGGAFLYPLGAWYFTLAKSGVIHLGTLQDLLADPQRMDRVWIFGRAFVLAAFCISAVVLYLTLRECTSDDVSLVCLLIYLCCPASVMFSQVLKPHWYSLLWVNLALLTLVRGIVREWSLRLRDEIFIAMWLGLAVGSVTTNGLFAVLMWFAIVGLVAGRRAKFLALVRIPAIAVVAFAASNPFYFIDWQGMLIEADATAAWFKGPAPGLESLFLFFKNSLTVGFGAAFSVLAVALAAYRLWRSPVAETRYLALGTLASIVTIGILTSSLATWHINFRYAPYLLPWMLLLVATDKSPRRYSLLVAVALLTVLQAMPLKLAYFDENDPAHSTRLRAAAWVDANIPAGTPICLNTGTPAPYDVPPFDLTRYPINADDCQWKVSVERETDDVVPPAESEIVQRFRPRFSPERFPLAFSHINPQITIYRRTLAGP